MAPPNVRRMTTISSNFSLISGSSLLTWFSREIVVLRLVTIVTNVLGQYIRPFCGVFGNVRCSLRVAGKLTDLLVNLGQLRLLDQGSISGANPAAASSDDSGPS